MLVEEEFLYPSPEEEFLLAESALMLDKAVQSLSPVQRVVLTARYGLDGSSTRKAVQIAEEYELPRLAVEGAEKSARDILRRKLRSYYR